MKSINNRALWKENQSQIRLYLDGQHRYGLGMP